ncbi:Retrovirus-related Pol polyprotein from transposon TNT 1-94 [Vitis vinifera]|uniref:Retrovirus-related Pol polyprotein from transposon TNT 1-94 n=1 Tax=Vitis vinifera TaxID=29760 RepID=A0A438EIE7_VITVI|nr:Retrovirus-related Pol polyprotein from transposon TNT 1-94 [Vitis vinifera]
MTTYLKLLTTTMYDGVSGVRDHIIKLKHYFNKANEMKVELSEKFLKWLILDSLPTSFDVVKLTYDALKKEWTLEELMSIVVQHEVSLKKNETHFFALVTDQVSNMKKKPPHKNFGGFKQFNRKGNSSQGTSNASTSSNATKNEIFKGKCNFCLKIGHKQVDCFKFKNWLEKKKKNTGATIHVTNSLQEMTNKRRPSKQEECVYMGDGSKVKEKPIKVMKSYRCGEYYGRCDEIGRNPRPFAKFLLECGIDARYTMPDTPQQKGVVERRNRTLLDMVSYGQRRNRAFTISMFGDVRLRGSRFYCPSHTTKIIESDTAIYFEDEVNVDPNLCLMRYLLEKSMFIIPFPTSHVLDVDVPIIQQPTTNQGEHGDQMEPGILVDGAWYDGYDASDPITYQEAIHCPQFTSWKEAMDDEMNSMYMNGVWDLVEWPHGCKPVGCKNLLPMSTKDTFRVVMAIVAHFDLELHQMDVKTTFLTGDLDKDMYMEQPTGFAKVGKEDLVCKFNKSIYGLKQASR